MPVCETWTSITLATTPRTLIPPGPVPDEALLWTTRIISDARSAKSSSLLLYTEDREPAAGRCTATLGNYYTLEVPDR